MASQTFTSRKDYIPYSVTRIVTALACLTFIPSALLAGGLVVGALLSQ